ncbi:MAG TPA: hypothetical protein VFI70_13240 [Nitrososphaeraceae archaeon]|nr:hypothetical protein [Nitrososphaeraceae archaeon]
MTRTRTRPMVTSDIKVVMMVSICIMVMPIAQYVLCNGNSKRLCQAQKEKVKF